MAASQQPKATFGSRVPSGLRQPNRDRLRGGLLRPPLNLRVGQCAERMFDDDRQEVCHAERVALHFGFVQKLGCHDDCGRAAGGFESDGVMRTARRA